MSQKFAKNLLITGANRGLGLEFVKKLANRVDILFAGCRKPSEAKVKCNKFSGPILERQCSVR